MKLVTFNIRCDYEQDGANNFCYRKSMILDKIQYEAPDIICFQEVLPHVAMWLKDNLTNYYIIGCGRDENLEDEQTTIAYKKSTINLLEMEVFWLSETPKVPGSRYKNQSIYPRTCTMALFQNTDTKAIFRIYNTHLDHVSSEARQSGLDLILSKTDQKDTFVNAPVIITGDFNAYPDSIELMSLQAYPQLIDLTAKLEGTFHDFGQLKKAEKIDYIIAQDNIQCNQVSLWKDCNSGVYLSDHYPVCADIHVNN